MFKKAIDDLEASGQLVGQVLSFQEYISQQGLKGKRTAEFISINSRQNLKGGLREANCMVFRLGSPKGSRNTHFALAKTVNGWSDYFFIDSDVFNDTSVEVYQPNSSVCGLSAYKKLSQLTETSLVNLAWASGILQQSLCIPATGSQFIPATARSSFTFEFQPISASDKLLTHNQGQVEIDALFMAHRDGKECLFVVEAKHSKKFTSLSKHKLLYPILALPNNIDSDIEVIPVYLRTIRKDGYVEFNIVECSLPRKEGVFGALDELVAENVSRYSLHGY